MAGGSGRHRSPRIPRSRCGVTNENRTAALTLGRNHGHVNGSAAELPRRGAVWDIDVQTAFAYCAARIEDPVRSVVRRSSRNPNPGSERQHGRIRCDDTFRDGDARCGNAAGAVRSRRKQQWCSRSRRSLRCRHLRWRLLGRRCPGQRHLRRRCLGRRRRVNSMGTSGNGQEQHRDSGVPSNRCDRPIHGVGLPQTAIRRRRTVKFA
jgi:hypothetical protein